MSSRRSRQSRSSTSRAISDDQILDLISKLRQLVPEIRHSQSSKLSASKFLQETCNYIRGLQREVDDLSERLSHLLSTIDADSAEASIITAAKQTLQISTAQRHIMGCIESQTH